MNEHDEELLDRLMALRAIPGSPLAKARVRAHQALDALWQHGHMTRKKAYKWLSRQMKLHPDECHMIYFDEKECEKVIHLCRRKILSLEAE